MKKEFYEKLESWLKSSEPFSLDTNVLVALISESKFSILTRLSNAKNFVLTPTTASELIGLCYSDVLDDRGVQQVKSFVALCKSNGRIPRIDVKAIERKLSPLANLLPRKIVIDVVIGDKDSFVNGLIEKYAQLSEYMKTVKRITLDYSGLSREYRDEKLKLPARCLNALEERLLLNRVVLEKKVEEKFTSEVNKILERTVIEVEQIIGAELKKRGRILETIENIKLKLMNYSAKKYTADVKIVSEAVANGASLSSFDSDVIFLMTLYSAANVA